jgi:TolB-like protein
MAEKLNGLEKFWRELKRRKTGRVIVVYSATAFIILQLTDIIAQPLQLPAWTLTLVIVLLVIGFIIAVLLSWVYDITPSGVKKTKPVSTVKHIDQTASPASSGWKIATYISAIIIVVLVAFNFISKGNLNADISKLEKSIAVLPFLNDSPDTTNLYFCNGMMDEILTQLQKIGDLKVKSRTSGERYRNPGKDIKDIGRELGVSLIVEGSVRKAGDDLRITAQLINAKTGDHLWAETYDGKYTDKIFEFQSNVAKRVVTSLNAVLTSEEKQLIEKTPTTNLPAYDLYLRANNYLKEYEKNRDLSSYNTAANLYKEALEIDSAYAKAYTGLALAYYDRYQWETYFKENYLDSMLVLTDKAYSIDDQLDEVYYLKGVYSYRNGQPEEALDNLDKALKINPNYYSAFERKGYILTWILFDFIESVDNYNRALNLIRGEERVSVLLNLGLAYINAGFPEKAKDCFNQALMQNGDSATYFSMLGSLEFSNKNLVKAILFREKASKIDSTIIPPIEWYSFTGQHQKAYFAAKRAVGQLKNSGNFPLQYSHRIGYAFWKAGKKSEAKYYFNLQIKYGEESIRLGREYALNKTAHYDLAGVYAFLGDKVKAYQYLEELNKVSVYPLGGMTYAKFDVLFDSMRNEERFQKVFSNVEAKYQAEHERVKKWLEEKGML